MRRQAARGIRYGAVIAVVAVFGLPGIGMAQEPSLPHIDGTPLDVYVDGLGALQLRHDGEADGAFFPPGSNAPWAGLAIVGEGDGVYSSPFPSSPGERTGNGPALSERDAGTQVLTSFYEVDTHVDPQRELQVLEEVAYTDGEQRVAVRYEFRSLDDGPVTFRAGELADLYAGGDDRGTGVFSEGPPRFVGGQGLNGTIVGLSELTPWAGYEEDYFADVFDDFPSGFESTINPDLVDNAVGVDWIVTATPQVPYVIEVEWQISQAPPAALPQPASPPPTPAPTPPPPPPPPPPPAPDGDELPPPVLGESVNALRSKGKVRIRVPGTDRFRVLEEGEQIPLGTEIDTRKGRVTLISAADDEGRTQQAWFYKGTFELGQQGKRRPVTTLKLTGKLRCGTGEASTAARKKGKKKRGRRKRRLWGSGKGRFRTRGKYSSATVRGTKWLTEDRCKSTLTRVKKGKVVVRDRVKRKRVIVKAGRRYVARKKAA